MATCGSTGWSKSQHFRSKRNSLFANVTDEVIEANRAWLDERYIEPGTGRFILSHHSYVVRTSRWTAIVDTCCGNHKERPGAPFWHRLNQPYLENMEALGVHPHEVDFVMCTHLHVDHVGWNTQLVDGSWVPTFPRARYLMGRMEYEHWEKRAQAAPGTRDQPRFIRRSRSCPSLRQDRPSLSALITACLTIAKRPSASFPRPATP